LSLLSFVYSKPLFPQSLRAIGKSRVAGCIQFPRRTAKYRDCDIFHVYRKQQSLFSIETSAGGRFNLSVANQNREHRRGSRRHGRQANYSDASAAKGLDLPYITLVISARAMRALSRLIGGRDRYTGPQGELFGKEAAFFGLSALLCSSSV